MAKVLEKFYMHSSKESNWDLGMSLGIDRESDAMDRFKYTGYEIAFTVEVDTDTGECYAIAVEGTMLEKPVRMN